MISTYIRQGRQTLRRWAVDPTVHSVAGFAAHLLAGFCMSAASIEQGMLPLVTGLVWACRGWRAVLVALGGASGYWIFWGSGSLQGILWTGLSLLGVLLLADRRISREQPLLIPAAGMLMVSATGLGFQILAEDTTGILLYLIRVLLGGAGPWIFIRWRQKKEPLIAWLGSGFLVLGLAQIAPVHWLNLGFVAAGIGAVSSPLACAALTGLALDAAGITPVPMTAVIVMSFLVRFLPRSSGWVCRFAPGCAGILLMYLCGQWDPAVLPGLFLGGIAGGLFTQKQRMVQRRGETGVAQVRLEMAAEVLIQAKEILQDAPDRFVDTDALVVRATEEACAGCAARERCKESRKLAQMTGGLLQNPLMSIEELPVRCKKSGRVLAQLRHAQEQMRALQADRKRQQEYREAVIQQYDFLGDFLQSLSERMSGSSSCETAAFEPAVSVYGNRSAYQNGDRCMEFAGVRNQYFVLLCDGMGTGLGAVREGKTATALLRKMLVSGFPAQHALQSLNSLCALRDRAGAVTVDLAQICLHSGAVTLYKWGAAASYLWGKCGVEKLGSTSVPPGVSVNAGKELRCSTSLKRGQILLLVSDGVEEQQVLDSCAQADSPAALAEKILRQETTEDDATVITIQLIPCK